jgi:tetratricopeptide (TPR) repeat protein
MSRQSTVILTTALLSLTLPSACESTQPTTPAPTAEETRAMPTENQPADFDRPNFDELWDYNDPAGTEAKFREILPSAQAAQDWQYTAELLTQIARTQGLQRDFAGADLTLNTARDMIQDPASVAQVRYLLERGRRLNSDGKPDEARPLFLEAWGLAQQLGADFHAVDAAHMLGIVDKGKASLAWNERAMEVAEASSDPRARNWLGSLYNNTGWTYHDMERYDRALKLFEKALDFRESQGNQTTIRIARWCIARCYRSVERIDEALALQQALAEEYAATGDKDGYVQEELGECLLLLEREEEARPHFARAYAILSQDPWLQANEPERLQRLKQLSGL